MSDREGDEDNRASTDRDAAGPVVGDCLLAKERHMQHADMLSWVSG